MPQIDTRQVSLNSIMKRPGFQQGMTDYHAGRAMPKWLPADADEWGYERGRLFAAATGQRFVHMTRGTVKLEQQIAFARLLEEKVIL